MQPVSPARFLLVVLIYFSLFAGITVVSSTSELAIDFSPEKIFIMKIIQVLTVVIFFILPAVVFTVIFTKEKVGFLQLNKLPALLFTLISALLMVFAIPLISYLEELNKQLHLPAALAGIEHWMRINEDRVQQIEDAFLKGSSLGDLGLNLFVIAFMAAFGEELFFRGLLQRSILQVSKNVHFSVWITAILFSAFHMQFFGFIPRVLLGAVLGYMAVWSGSLWVNIIAHFINNGLILVISFLIDQHYLPKWVDKVGLDAQGGVSLLWVIPSFVLVGGSLLVLNRIKNRKVVYG